MDAPEPILRQIQANERQLQNLREQIPQLPANSSQRQKSENELRRISQAQVYWWNRLSQARGVTAYQFAPESISASKAAPSAAKPAAPRPGPSDSPLPASKEGTSIEPPISISKEKSAEFSLLAGSVYIKGKISVTGTLSVKPKALANVKNVGFDTNLTDATQTGEVAFDSALASAKSSVTYDSTTNLFDASISTSLKVGDGSVSFSHPSFVTGAVQGITITLESSPKPIKGSTSKYDIEGGIGLKVTATITHLIPREPIPFPAPFRRAVPRSPTPFGIPQGVLVSPILVPMNVWRKILEDNGLGEAPQA